jgi:uracil-DNA glycosylase
MSSLKRKAGEQAAAEAAKKPKQQGTLTSFFGAPKVVAKAGGTNGAGSSSGPGAPALKFDKEKWLAKLNEEQKRLLKLEIETLDDSWLAHLKDDVASPEFLELKRFLEAERQSGKKIFPPQEDIYSWCVLGRLSQLQFHMFYTKHN